MYEQQTPMLTLGLLNRNTGCQCCSVRCSSVSERHLGFSRFENFNFRSGSEAQYASPCQISRRSVEPFRRYGRFSIFKMAAVCTLEFLKVGNFNFRFADVEKCELGKRGKSLKIYKNGYLGRLGVTQGHWQCHHY